MSSLVSAVLWVKQGEARSRRPEPSKYVLDDKELERVTDGPFSNIKGLTYDRDNEKDPYITLKEDDTDDERDELEVLPTDNPLVGAKNEDEISQLEIYVYDESQENLYVYHDLMLPNFPQRMKPCSQHPFWADPTKQKHISPHRRSVQRPSTAPRPRATTSTLFSPSTGTKRSVSGSADRTVKPWDLSRDPTIDGDGGGAIRSFDVHNDEVQVVRWNDRDASVLLTGSYDRTVWTFDSRAPDTGVAQSSEVSLENGLFTLSAHDDAASALDVNPHIRGCIATGGNKLVKVWNVLEEEDGGKRNVSLVISRDLGVVRKVFSPGDPLTLAAAESKAKLQIWGLLNLERLGGFYGRREGEGNRSGVVGVVSDDEESGGEDDDE
ncbi:WD40-repeat-containing domain protein [Mycena galopus ATCC 62051]|nr:WD40-repeat-containing domain protein [Mycena galopus ATCC 62051]